MITDQLKHYKQYTGLSQRINEALTYLAETDMAALEVGKYEIDGDNLFVLIQSYEAKAIEAGKCEAHKKYIDIQYIIEGQEYMGYGPSDAYEVIDPYNDDKDRYFVKWAGDLVKYEKDMFAIFYPQDAHMPGIAVNSGEMVKKAVVKIKI